MFNKYKQHKQYQYQRLKEENTEEEDKRHYEDNWTQRGDGKCEEEIKKGDGSSNNDNDNGEYKK